MNLQYICHRVYLRIDSLVVKATHGTYPVFEQLYNGSGLGGIIIEAVTAVCSALTGTW